MTVLYQTLMKTINAKSITLYLDLANSMINLPFWLSKMKQMKLQDHLMTLFKTNADKPIKMKIQFLIQAINNSK